MRRDEGNALAYMSRALQLNERIDSAEERSHSLRTLLMNALRGGDGVRAKELAVELAELEAQLIEDTDALVDLKAEIGRRIERMPDIRMQLILELRYLCARTWEQVADDLGLSPAYVRRLHKSAIRCFHQELVR